MKVGDLVRLSTSEWAPPFVDGPYGDWIGVIVERKKRSGKTLMPGDYFVVDIPGSERLAVVYEGSLELVQEAL